MRVLITGGAGFIGSHLADAYLERGDEVFVLDDLSTGSIDNIRHLRANPRFHYTIESVHHGPTVAELVDQCDVVFHLAAAVGVRLIVESPVRTIETNVHGTEVVLAQANKKKKKVLIASTSEVYGLRATSSLSRGWQPRLGPDVQGALELRLLEGDRRVPGAGLLAGAQAADGDRPAVQHGRTAPDRAIRHGRADIRQAGPHRPPHHDSRRRQPVALFHRRQRRRRRIDEADGSSRRGGRSLQRRLERGNDDSRSGRAGQGADGVAVGNRLRSLRASLRRRV